MSGPAESKIELKNATVYVHKQDEATGSRTIHIDVEHPDLNDIIQSGENTFCGGKQGGIFLGLKSEMQKRAEEYVKEREET